jgi:dTDP-glucose 4,6-dehydratase
MLAESFHRSFDLPVVIIRPFNTYGPRQSDRAVIPTILSQLYRGNKQVRLGALHPSRDFNFVEDTISGFLALAEADGAIGRVVNVGSGKEISVGDLANRLVRITGKEAEIICEEERLRPATSEVDRLLCDASLARELTGWAPEYTLEEGLAVTAHWVENNLSTFASRAYSI